jgi:hypothetical protein
MCSAPFQYRDEKSLVPTASREKGPAATASTAAPNERLMVCG